MWIKLELAAIVLGNLTAAFLWFDFRHGNDLWPEIHQQIFIVSPVSTILGFLLIIGAGGSVLFVINMLFKRWTGWPARLSVIVIGYMCFWEAASSVQ